MFDIDFRRMIVTIALVSAIIGGVIALVLLVWPWLWALARPVLQTSTA